jgi:hypothetical protein
MERRLRRAAGSATGTAYREGKGGADGDHSGHSRTLAQRQTCDKSAKRTGSHTQRQSGAADAATVAFFHDSATRGGR